MYKYFMARPAQAASAITMANMLTCKSIIVSQMMDYTLFTYTLCTYARCTQSMNFMYLLCLSTSESNSPSPSTT